MSIGVFGFFFVYVSLLVGRSKKTATVYATRGRIRMADIDYNTIDLWLDSHNLVVNGDLETISQALTHPSATGSQGNATYERLEFLGDRVLGLVIAELLYKAFPEEKEGALTRRVDSLVNRETLAEVAEESGLSQFLKLSNFPPKSRVKILSDTCEAVLGALYLEGGLDLASTFILDFWQHRLYVSEDPPQHPKSALQELLQRQYRMPQYEVVDAIGPSHAPSFIIQVSVVPEGPSLQVKAGSKREGERLAAEEMLKVLQKDPLTWW